MAPASFKSLNLQHKHRSPKLQKYWPMTFADLGLNKNLLNRLEEIGWEVPTPIQVKAIPIAMSGQDIIGIAQTGTGKTGAFLLPILVKLGYQHQARPRALIFAPTKELAKQIGEHFEELNVSDQIKHAVLVGGVGIMQQIKEVEAGVDVLICTPGRFMEIYHREVLSLRAVNSLVLDEADRLMDMGFMPQLRMILEIIPNKRQNMLFSATYPQKVEELSFEFLEFPTRVEVAEQSTPAANVEQFYYAVNCFGTKMRLLVHLLSDREVFNKVIVFVNTKETANKLNSMLSEELRGQMVVIHSNKSQSNRSASLEEFTVGNKRILITTNVSSRGIDVAEVSHVINFEMPHVFEDYVHRIGRTGRAYKVGKAISFAHKAEQLYMESYKTDIKQVDLPAEVKQVDVNREELISIEREIDRIKRKDDPNYKGAFHQKKKLFRRPTKKVKRR